MPSLLRQLQDGKSSDKTGSSASKRTGSKYERKTARSPSKSNHKASSSSSKARESAHRDFIAATAKTWGNVYTDYKRLPDLNAAFTAFKEIYPRYSETLGIESLRVQEYAHLEESGRVCLDYCGFGLFSYLQQSEDWESASFTLSSLSVNLCSHAIFGAANEGTVECDIRKRIMNYLNIQENEYSMVFTASRGAAFKLLADVYPFDTARRLVTMYDYESESLGWLAQRAKEKGAKISDVSFKWPSLRVISSKLRKLLIVKGSRKRKGSAAGLFVFPVQSRVSGAKYSYQWMSLAQQNKWHVLLDASALGPKDMDSLGLSMFKPDFIIASFYKVFGADPSGFGCLFIKNTAMRSVQNQAGAPAPGIVRIIPFPIDWSSNESLSESIETPEGSIAPEKEQEEEIDFEFPKSSHLIQGVPSFSGPMLGFDNFNSPDDREDANEDGKGNEDDDSSVCDSVGEVSRSPVFSEEGTEFCLDTAASPAVSASRTSISDDQFSGPFSGPIQDPICNGQANFDVPSRLQNPLFRQNGWCGLGQNATENLGLANGELCASSGSVPQGSTFLSKASSLLQNGDSHTEKGKDDSVSSIRKKAPHIMENPTPSDSKGDADFANVLSDCTQFEKRSSCNEIEIVEESILATKAGNLDGEPWRQSESALKRETEGDFRLLGRRDGDKILLGCSFSPLQDSEDKGSFNGERRSCASVEGLDHADMLGLNKSTLRHRYLINWLVSSLLQLQHPHSGTENATALVHIYGPQIKYDRGASIAFNLYDCHRKLIHPEVVQLLADQHNISLSIGFLKNLQVSEDDWQFFEGNQSFSSKGFIKGRDLLRMEVLTAALSILSSFEDVYKLWCFLARFLDAGFVTKELDGSSNQ
ncbi:hypothetical protein KP509_19G052700 [Ceratopteris richardii]|uniref:Molybdenum cofactor sulfurase n=1 Tax=Ceratopteris richardii TaxID=49495 RepID=A0A8T2SM53_CERRI|nr:hypothetical protein KP509_19G052700 [Ceratopteris richardii]